MCGGLLSDKIFDVATFELRQSMAAFTPSRVVSVEYGWNRADGALNGRGPVHVGGTECFGGIPRKNPTGCVCFDVAV